MPEIIENLLGEKLHFIQNSIIPTSLLYYVSFFDHVSFARIFEMKHGLSYSLVKEKSFKNHFPPPSHLSLCLKGCRRRKHCSIILALDQQKIKIPIQIFFFACLVQYFQKYGGVFVLFFFFNLFFVSSKCESDYTFV